MRVLLGAAWAGEPACTPVTDEEVRAAADRVRTEARAVDHEALVGELLSRLTCAEPARIDDPWTQLLLAEAHVHHATAREAAPLVPVALALPASGAPPSRSAPAPGEAEEGPLAAGPPEPQDEGGTARIKVRGPVTVRLEGWTGTFRGGEVPTGAYVVLPRPPPDFVPVQALAIYAATDDVWRVRCTRAGTCDAVRLAGEPPPPPSPLPEGERAGPASSPPGGDSEPARFVVEGHTRVELRGPCGTCAPGPVPAGAYQVFAWFGPEPVTVGAVEAAPGQTVTVTCSVLGQSCKVAP